MAALRAETGQVIWFTNLLASVYSSPSVQKDALYVGSARGVADLDAATGLVRWITVPGAVDSSPVAEKDVVYVGAHGSGTDYQDALEATTGQILYRSIAP